MQWLFVMIIFAWPTNRPGDSSVVATVGGFVITENDLIDSFEIGPAFVRRLENPLRKHLEYMINERLLALLADSLEYGQSDFVKERFSALEEDLAVDELYKAEILSRVQVRERDVAANMQKARMNVRYRWMYAPTKDGTGALWSKIEKGQSFDSLFQRQLEGEVTLSNRSAETNLLKLEGDNPDFAAPLSKLKSGEISRPLEGNDGYYIVQVGKLWQNPLSTQTEQASLRGEAIRLGKEIQANALGVAYVKGKMKQADPVLKAEGFNILRAYLAEKGLSRDMRVKWSIPATFMTEAGPQPLSASRKFLNRTLVLFGKQTLTVMDYVRWFDIRQFQLKTHSLAAFNSSIKRTIWKMVQDKLLVEEAYRSGYQLRDTVRHESKKWQAKLLYLAGRAHVLRLMTVDEETLRKVYGQQKNHYRDSAGKIMPYDQVKENLRAEALNEQETVVLFRTLQALKKSYPVFINDNRMKQLSLTVKNDPGAIDVMFYKPGGTFPRVAFPTIDEAWVRLQ